MLQCYANFFMRYCPNCGKPLDFERAQEDHGPADALDKGGICVCSCGAICRYLPEQRFPDIDGDIAAIA